MIRAKVDRNQPEIVAAWRKAGATVQHLHSIGKGCPDALVGYMGVNVLAEIKDGSKPPSARKLTADEAQWHRVWRGQLAIVSSVKEAMELLQRVVDTKLSPGNNE